MKKVLLLTLICFLASLCYCLAKDHKTEACHNSGTIPPGTWWKTPEVAKDLNLTTEEQKQLNDLYLENRRKMVDFQSQVKKERIELEKLFDAESLNEAECLDQFRKIQNTKEHKAVENFSFIANVRKLLGKDRFQRLKGKIQKRCVKYGNERRKMRKAN